MDELLVALIPPRRRVSFLLGGVVSSSIVTPDFTRKTECISYVRQDKNYTHMIDNRV
jgi:hypothetical protein